jgi:hypothetical protein
VLNSDFFSFTGSDSRLHVDKLAVQVSVLVDFFLSKVSFSGKTNLLFFLDIADDKDGVGVVPADNFVDLDVRATDAGTGRVPSNDSFLAIDSSHHVEHLLMVDVIEKPNFRLLQVLFERNRIAISYIKDAVIAIFSEQCAYHSLFCSTGDSVVVVYNRQ